MLLCYSVVKVLLLQQQHYTSLMLDAMQHHGGDV